MTVTGLVQSHPPPLASIASCKKPLLSSCWYWIFSSHTILTTGFPGWYLYSWAICWLHVLTLKLWTSSGQSAQPLVMITFVIMVSRITVCPIYSLPYFSNKQINRYRESGEKFSCHQVALMSLIPCKFLTISCKIDYIHYQQDIFLWCGYKVMTPNHGLVRQESKVVTVTGFLLWCDSLVRV